MFDMHYDLLTYLYMCYLNDDMSPVKNWCKSYNTNNITGVIANLSFTSIDEMNKEYVDNYYDSNVGVIEMFRICSELLETYVDSNINVLKSIEGLDYLKDITDLDILKELGLKVIIPFWNTESKYGSGNRSSKGLTELGHQLIWRAFEINLAVDLSHSNKKTFDDIIELAKKAKIVGLDPIIFISHTGLFEMCPRDRNNTLEQMKKVTELDGIVGLFSNRNFITLGAVKDKIPTVIMQERYLSMVNLVVEECGINNVGLSTDDMTFSSHADLTYAETPIFKYSCIFKELNQLLEKEYDDNERFLLLEGNIKRLINRLKG